MTTIVPNHWKNATRGLIAAVLCGLFAAPISAITIEYQAEDLTDAGMGDLWRYSYQVSDHAFLADEGFQILFDFQTYGGLQDPPPLVNSDWDPLVTQPDSGLSIDGIYDALALVDAPSLADLFVLEFIWVGTGTPSAQPFDVYDANFQITFSGTTVLATPGAVPLPMTPLLLVFGLAALLALSKKTTRGLSVG